jgi:hypothetical protein
VKVPKAKSVAFGAGLLVRLQRRRFGDQKSEQLNARPKESKRFSMMGILWGG